MHSLVFSTRPTTEATNMRDSPLRYANWIWVDSVLELFAAHFVIKCAALIFVSAYILDTSNECWPSSQSQAAQMV